MIASLILKSLLPTNAYLEEYLEDQEDYLIALARSERIEKGLDKPLSFEEVLKELNLDKEDLH